MKIDPKKIARLISEDPNVPSDHFDDTEDEYVDDDPNFPDIPQFGLSHTEALLQRAEEIARSAHEGQLYGDVPYINHPLAVKARVGNNLMAQVVAILHDVLEDTPASSQDLLDAGIPPAAVTAVEAITRSAGEKYFAYIARLNNNPIARIVKMADLEENLSNLPEGHSLENRYLKALEILKA